jgi:hypothetical protein
MADLTRANVTILNSWTEGGVASKRHTALQVQAEITSAGSGASSNKIPASAFGMSSIIDCSDLIKSDDAAVVSSAPNYAGTELLLSAGNSTTPTSVTGTFRGIVKGIMS